MRKLSALLFLLVAHFTTIAQSCPQQILGNDTTVFVLCSTSIVDLTQVIQTRGLNVQWDVSSPAKATLGVHKLIVDSSGCKDTVFVAVRQDIKTWIGNVSDDWHDPLNWSDNSVPKDSSHVIINTSTYPCIISNSDATVASIQVIKEGNFKVVNNHHLNITGKCDSLPTLIELSPITVIIDSITSQLIQSVDSNTVVFNGNSPQLQSLSVGKIIASGIVTNAPYGFLRKIAAIQHNGIITTLSTTEVPLTEAFKELHVDYTKAFLNSDTAQRKLSPSSTTFSIQSPNYVLYDADGNYGTSYDQLKTDVSLELTPEIHSSIHVSWFRLDYARFECGFQRDLNLTVTAGGSIGSLSKKVNIYSQPLAPITIPGTPIVIVPFLRVSLGAAASINVQISATDINTSKVSAYVEYQNGTWQSGFNKTTQNQFVFNGISGNVDAKIYVEPAIDFKLYGSDWAKGSIFAQAYLRALGQLSPASCQLKAGVNAGAEVKLQFLGWSATASYPNIFDYSQTLYTCPSSQMPSVTTSSVSNVTPSSASSGGNVTSSGGASVTARGVCWSTSHNPTTSNSKTVNGSGTGSFASSITGLSSNTTYYVRAYATNSVGTAYGSEVSFATQQTSNLPSLTTTTISGITQTSAQGGGTISSSGSSSITARGVCWSTTSNPTTANSKTSDGTGVGSFTSSITNLSSNTTYYVRAYASNGTGTAYGNEVSFATSGSSGGTTVTDIDGNVYNVIQIGTQYWMKENLRVSKYKDGSNIQNKIDSVSWFSTTVGAYCYYNNDVTFNATYGKIYNWYAVSDSRGLCPNGWHVPSDNEWKTLEAYLGMASSELNLFGDRGTLEGGKLKSTSSLWYAPNTGANNNTNFSVLPGGYGRLNFAVQKEFDGIRFSGIFHTSSYDSYNKVISRGLDYNSSGIGRYQFSPKNQGFYCRCLKN